MRYTERMERREPRELGVIFGVAVGCWAIAPVVPRQIEIGSLLLIFSALLLLQSLIRDLWLLASARLRAAASPLRVGRVMCVESTVGATGIVMGVMLLGTGINQPVTMARWSWTLGVFVVTGIGWLLKDYVIEAGPWRVRRDRDHLNMRFRWKR